MVVANEALVPVEISEPALAHDCASELSVGSLSAAASSLGIWSLPRLDPASTLSSGESALIDALIVSSAAFDARFVAGHTLGSWREARPETRFDVDSELTVRVPCREVYVDTGTDDAGVGPADMHRSPWMIRGIEPRAGMSASVALKTCPALETKEQKP